MTTAKAGWAQIDMTPPLGLPMGGRGPRFSAGEEVIDPLAAQALVLEDGQGRRTVWICMDMIGMTWQMTSRLRMDIAALAGIPFEAIVVNFSHTHSGYMSGFEGYATVLEKPAALVAYEENLLARTCKMVLEAVDNLRPVTVEVYRGESSVGINRRGRNPDGSTGMRPDADGFINRDLWVLDLQGADRRCVVFSYGCHPVTVYSWSWGGISADFPGVCRDRLTAALGPGVQAQFIQGLAGNVRPRRLADEGTQSFRKATAEDYVRVGEELAGDVIAALEADGESLELDLKCVSGLALAPRDLDVVPGLEHWQKLAASDEELQRNLGAYWVRRLGSGIPPMRCLPWAVGLIRLAPGHTVAWLANEVVAEWLPLLRGWLDDPGLVAWGYCQDGRNYMPTDALIPQGGYEVINANAYTTAGPGPFALGINGVAKKAFEGLAGRL